MIRAWIIFSLVLVTSCHSRPADVVRVGYFANVTHAQAVLAMDGGRFAMALAPLKVEGRVFNAGPALMEALLAGEIDVAYVGPGPVLNVHDKSRGQAVRVISGAAANGVLIVARADSGIGSMADLKGKRVASPQMGNTQDVAAKHFLSAELKQGDVANVLPVANAEQGALMVRGQIDAAWVPEPWGSRLMMENGAKLIAQEKDLWPEKRFALTLVVTTPRFLKERSDVVEKVLAVHSQLTRELRESPQSFAGPLRSALAKLTGKALPREVVEKSLGHVEFTDDPMPATLATMARWSFELKLLNRPPDLAGLVVAPGAAGVARVGG